MLKHCTEEKEGWNNRLETLQEIQLVPELFEVETLEINPGGFGNEKAWWFWFIRM